MKVTKSGLEVLERDSKNASRAKWPVCAVLMMKSNVADS